MAKKKSAGDASGKLTITDHMDGREFTTTERGFEHIKNETFQKGQKTFKRYTIKGESNKVATAKKEASEGEQ